MTTACSTHQTDTFKTASGRNVSITFLKHASLMFDIDGYIVQVDPVSEYADYSKLPKADLILVTHDHYDHFDRKAIQKLWKKGETRLICNGAVAEVMPEGEAMKTGESKDIPGKLSITATAAYNFTPGHLQFHPKGLNVGFLLQIDNLRIFISGDTEDIPELSRLKNIDIAFLSTNQPYTMTPKQCIHAIEMIQPKIVYPYHFSETDLTAITDAFKDNKNISVRLRDMP